MKIRVYNQKETDIKVILEPWATEYELSPDDYIDFVSEGSVPGDAYFEVTESDHGLVVCPEWEKALVYSYSSKGKLLD